jgi:hypothetical protein
MEKIRVNYVTTIRLTTLAHKPLTALSGFFALCTTRSNAGRQGGGAERGIGRFAAVAGLPWPTAVMLGGVRLMRF